jgi:hypothetical protein
VPQGRKPFAPDTAATQTPAAWTLPGVSFGRVVGVIIYRDHKDALPKISFLMWVFQGIKHATGNP